MLMDVDRLLEQMEREDQFRSPGLLYTEEVRFLLGLGPKVEDPFVRKIEARTEEGQT